MAAQRWAGLSCALVVGGLGSLKATALTRVIRDHVEADHPVQTAQSGLKTHCCKQGGVHPTIDQLPARSTCRFWAPHDLQHWKKPWSYLPTHTPQKMKWHHNCFIFLSRLFLRSDEAISKRVRPWPNP